MLRREFIKTSSVAAISMSALAHHEAGKSHILTFSFDDGFKKSFTRVAEIHEEYDLKACLNVIATGHFKNFKAIDEWIRPELMGDFNDWNSLISRGHEIMPHTWEHLNLTKVPMIKAQKNLDKCLDYFRLNLDGYKDSEAIYNYAYNASNEELDQHLLQRVAAVRTAGWVILNDTVANEIPKTNKNLSLGCWLHFKPGNGDHWVEEQVNEFLKSDGGWMIINLHGLDEEGWAPVSTSYFDTLLKRLVDIETLIIATAGEVISQA